MPAAGWTRTARDLSQIISDPDEARRWWTIDKVVDHTGLSEATLRDIMARQPITSAEVPRAALCRPAGRIGLLSAIPLWSAEQIEDYDNRCRAAATARIQRRNTGGPDVPSMAPEAAAKRGLASIATLSAELQCAPNTLRRFAREYADTFPPTLAVEKRPNGAPHGRQHQLRDRVAVLRWLVSNPARGGAELASTARRILADEGLALDEESDAVAVAV